MGFETCASISNRNFVFGADGSPSDANADDPAAAMATPDAAVSAIRSRLFNLVLSFIRPLQALYPHVTQKMSALSFM